MRQTTRSAVRQVSYPLAMMTIGATMVTFLRRSVLITHRTKQHQLEVREFRAKVRAMLDRRRSNSSSSDPSSYKCPI